MAVQLIITDGTDSISLLSGDDGLFLNSWRPAVVQPKGGGTYQASSLAEGRRLADRRFANAIESFDLKISGLNQDEVARRLQDLRRLLEKSVQYWVTAWQGDPVYLIVQASNETNVRYAVIHNWSTPDDENPFNNPFLQPDCAAIVDNWTLSIERGHWLENAPENSTCVQVSGQQEGVTYTSTTDSPTESGDDGQFDWLTLTITLTGTTIEFSNDTGTIQSGIRFRSVTVPQGATIASAFIRLRASATDASTLRGLIQIDNTDDAAIFTTDISNWTSARNWRYTVYWEPTGNMESWTSGSDYDTPDLTYSVQQVVNRVGWASGQDMAFLISPFSGNGERVFEAWDHASANEAELHITYEVSTITFGRAATCNDEVYVANKHNLSQITHCEVLDGAAWGGNLIGSGVPYVLLPAVPANNDAVYFGVNTGGPNTGPFCSLVFDLSTAVTNLSVAWQYWNGAWVALTTQDNTVSFSETGVNSVHWEQPSDWAANDPGNGITGYWVRALVTIGVGPTPPTQQNRDVYSIVWPSVLIDDAQVGGDVTALMRLYLKNHSHRDTFPLDDLDTYRVVCGIRSTSRGTDFTAYLNISDEQNPTGLTVSRDATDTDAFAADPTTPTGRVLVDNTTTLNAWVDLVTFTFSNILADDFYGTYHAFLRADQDGGAVGDIGYRLKVFYGNTDVIIGSDIAYFTTLNRWQVLDLGTFTYPGMPIDTDDVSESSGLIIQRYATSTTPTAELYDLIIIPTDEWAGDFSPKSEETEDSIQLTNYLDVDSLKPRHNIRALVRDEDNDFVLTRWTTIANGPATLQPNADQRLWFFTMELASDGSSELRAPPYQGLSVQMFRNQRYFSYRGDR